MKKRISSLLLAFVMLVGMLPTSTFATEVTEPTETVEISNPTEVEETTVSTEPEETTVPTEAEETTVSTEPEETTVPAETEETTVPAETEETEDSEAVTSLNETEPAAKTTGLDTSQLVFDIEDPAGYVTVSFKDNGVRPEGAGILNEELYGTAVGTIISETEVPYVSGDSVADVTVRLLNAMGLAYSHTGTVADGFYLAALKDFELNGTYYPTFGEFDAGSQSGWCVRVNNWHINQGSSAVEVEDGDVISWLYTCQYGADIGADFSSKSAEITDVVLRDNTLSLVYDEQTAQYTCVVPAGTASLAFEVVLENYASVVTVTVDGVEAKYRPNKAISVKDSSTIVIASELEYMDAANNNQVTTYTDSVTIQLEAEAPNNAPVVNESAPTTMEAVVGEEISVDLSNFFSDADGDALTYHIAIAALGIDQILEGSVFTGTIPAAGTYEAEITASDGEDTVSHNVTLTVSEAAANTAPNIKAEFAETNSKTYIYSNSYVYIYMDDIFEDADGDTLTYKVTLNGEETAISYNSWSKEYYIQFATKPAVYEYKIIANDGKADSEVFTARCIGTSAAITAVEGEPLIPNGNYLYYVMGTAENDTFAMTYTLDVDEDIATEWTSSNASALVSNGDGTFSVQNVTSRQQVYVGVTAGKDSWGSALYLGTKYIYLLSSMPAVADMSVALAEHADNQTATVVSTAVSGGWYSSEFDYEIDDPSVCDIATSGSYGLSITPKALGSTTVTATFKYDASIQCTFTVTVTGRSLQIKDQPDSDDVIFAEGKTVQLEVLGAEVDETFTWTSSDETVATVDEKGLVTIKSLGQTYITALSSLSSEEAPVKACMYLQVKEAGKVYLDDIAVTDYSYFDGFISAKSGFNSAQLTYDWSLSESRYTYNKLAFTPYFDDGNLDAIVHYQVSGGEYQTMELTSGSAVSITNGLNPGENIVKIDVYPTDDEEKVTTYTFHIFRPYNPSNTITRMTIYPNGETALAYPTYKDNKEGTLFQWDTSNNDFITGWGGRLSTGWSSSRDAYKVFVFGSRTSSISVYPTFAYAGQRVMIYVDGEEFEEAVTNWKSKTIPVDADGTVITFHVNSEKYHAEQVAAGVEDPFAVPEKVYTIYVESVEPLGIDSKILSAQLEGGVFYEPGFTSSSYTISGLIPSGETDADLIFTVPAGIDVYRTSVSEANKLIATGQDEDGNNIYTTPIVTITGTGMYAYSTTNIILQVTDEEGNIGKTQYAFTVSQRGPKDIYPDCVVEYLCIGSQYTNASSYGTMPERTLKNGGGTLSLGNFGGYIVYRYDTPIKNDPNNPYGVDFVIYGNSFGNGGHEPGYVQVSSDGKTWYTLAGSEHYEDHNDWGFSMTYTNNGGKSAWVDSDGESGEIYNYPLPASYPYFTWTEANQQSMTVSGPRLNSSAKDAYGSAAAVLPVFGYVDVNTNGTINGVSNNPYNHPGTLVAGGDQFDLDWAVDADGMPVSLDSISYIRIATASSIYAGAIGEKSTEVSTVTRVTNTAEAAVGVTDAPAVITVNGAEIAVPENGGTIQVDVSKEDLAVAVTAAEDVNIYIGNTGGTERSYTTIPETGIIRIIVQEGEKEPYICYLIITQIDPAVETVKALIDEIGDVTLDSEEAIAAAREAYDALTDAQKTQVTNYETLAEAEGILELLKRPVSGIENIYKTTGDYLSAQGTPVVGTVGGEWMVIGLARSDRQVPDGYYANVVKYVQDNIGANERLHAYKSTDNARVILALTAIGRDVTDVDGHNLLAGLNDMAYIQYQGINGPIWALIAFDSHDYEIPAGDVTREKLLEVILDAQLESGGWTLSGSVPDPDMTGMALQALAPYYGENTAVTTAVDEALSWLSGVQNADGSYSGTDGASSESLAQVITALTALGIDPEKDERFVKNGLSALDALAEYYVDGGGFKHIESGNLDGMATEQSYYALASWFRLLNGKTSLYDMSDVNIGSSETEPEDPTEPSEPTEPTDPSEPDDPTVPDETETISVTFTLLGCYQHGTGQTHTLAGGNLSTWIATKTYRVAAGGTVRDVLEKALTEAGLSWRNPSGNYVESINGIGEFTNGSNSGWMYTLNGTHPNLGVAQQTVKNGDVIVFHYTDDYTKEEGSQGYDDRDEAAAEEVEKRIDAIGTVTLNSESKISAARKAYDSLTYTQKKLVDNYSKLTAAENKLAQLQTAADEAAAEKVEELIDQISSGSNTFDDDVAAARKAYAALTAAQKKLVDNYYKLVNAEKELASDDDKEAAGKVEELIDDIGLVTLDSQEKINAARKAYDALTDTQKTLVENLASLEAAEERLKQLQEASIAEDIYKTTGDYLENLGIPTVNTVGGEWMVIGLARSGRDVPDGYYDNAIKYVQENIDENQRLHNSKSTDNARIILALTAIGKDVTNVDGHNLLAGLTDMSYVQKQGINGPIWALIAFDSGNYPIPDGGDVSREALIGVILDAQLFDGGWSLSGEDADPDMTGMAIQALAPYYQSNASVRSAIDEALNALSMMQLESGGYASTDGSSSESIAQVIVALTALGIDPDTDERFIKNDISAFDALLSYYVTGGGFKHMSDGSLDGMATEQSYYALTAYYRMQEDKNSLYDMTDVTNMGGDVKVEPTEPQNMETEPDQTEPADSQENKGGFPWWIIILSLGVCTAVVVIYINRKRIFSNIS